MASYLLIRLRTYQNVFLLLWVHLSSAASEMKTLLV